MSRTLTLQDARRLFIIRQHLSGLTDGTPMLDVIRDLGCLQLDPISVVARSHQIVLWSRLGNYDLAELDRLLYEERALFEYWAHAASIVLTEHYPLHHHMMRDYPSKNGSAWSKRTLEWVEENSDMRDHLMERLRADGPLFSREIDYDAGKWGTEKGWSGSNLNRMLDFLWTRGEVMVAGRSGVQRAWDISERLLPDWTPRHTLDDDALCQQAISTSLMALGVAPDKHIKRHFLRGRYPNLSHNLGYMLKNGEIERVDISDDEHGTLPGTWYIHKDNIPLLEQIQAGTWQPRTMLLSPFDNLICDRERTEQMFDFFFRIEIYVPKEKRQYGYYVLPILQGDRLIGRIDPKLDRKKKVLNINAVHQEDGAPDDAQTVEEIKTSIYDLAEFLGAEKVNFSKQVPDEWSALRS
ncbi:MAG: crosslink repair DNA glycosylase YcaQ family protein [Aggregatilineales bacterium]